MKAKSLPYFQKGELPVDREASVIRDVVIVQGGVDKMGDYFTDDFLNKLVDQGNAAPNGIKSRFGHPNMCSNSLGSALGRFKNFEFVASEPVNYVKADLHLAEISKKTQVEGRGISMHDYVIELAQEDHDLFGNSIVFRGGGERQMMEIDGEEAEVFVLELDQFLESDLVDSPAATTNLFKGVDDIGLHLSGFLDEHGDQIFKALEKNPNAIDAFFKHYFNKKTDMKLVDRIKGILGVTAQKDFDITTDTGDILTVVTDDERTTPMVGDQVTGDDGPVEDGDYVLATGETITVEGGAITAIEEAEGEDTPSEEIEEAVATAVEKAIAPLSARIEQVHKELSESIMFIAKNVKSKPIDLPRPKEVTPGEQEEEARIPSGYKK